MKNIVNLIEDPILTKKYRKFLIIFLDSDLRGPVHDEVKKILLDINIISYWFMCDEVSKENYNTDLVILFDIPVSLLFVQNKFPGAVIHIVDCSVSECIDILKNQGELGSDYKSLPETFEDIYSYAYELVNESGVFSWVSCLIQKLHTMIKRKK